MTGAARSFEVPSWVTEPWYGSDAMGQHLAMLRYHMPVTTLAERTAAAEFVAGETFACTSCGKFAFARPRPCFWCMRHV